MISHPVRCGLAIALASFMLVFGKLTQAEALLTPTLTTPPIGTLPVATQGLPGGVPVAVKVNGPGVKARIGIDAATTFQLQALKPGKYRIKLDAIQFSGYTWEPDQPVLKLALNRKGEFIRLPSREPLTGPLPLAYSLTKPPSAPATARLIVATTVRAPYGSDEYIPGFIICDPVKPDGCSAPVEIINRLFGANSYVKSFIYNDAVSLPPFHFGLSNGQLGMCVFGDSLNCFPIDNADTAINTLHIANNIVYSGLEDGMIWGCPSGANNCYDVMGMNSPVISLTSGDRLYAGYQNGVIMSCSLSWLHDCNTPFDVGGSAINSLVYANSRLYAGLSNGLVLSCDPEPANTCMTLVDLSNQSIPVNAMLYANNRLYIATASGVLLGCDPNQKNDCMPIGAANAPIGALAFGNNRIYASIQNGAVLSCDANQELSCFNLAKPNPDSPYPPSNGIVYVENLGQ